MIKIVKNETFKLRKFNRLSKIHVNFRKLLFFLKLIVSKVDINNKNKCGHLYPQKYTPRSTRHPQGFLATIKMALARDFGPDNTKSPIS